MGEQRAGEDVKWPRAASISRGKATIIDQGKPWCHRSGSSQRLGEKRLKRGSTLSRSLTSDHGLWSVVGKENKGRRRGRRKSNKKIEQLCQMM